MPSTAEKQRDYRKSLKSRGYKRLDIQISPKLFKQLRPHLGRYGDSHTGVQLVLFLEKLMKEWETGKK